MRPGRLQDKTKTDRRVASKHRKHRRRRRTLSLSVPKQPSEQTSQRQAQREANTINMLRLRVREATTLKPVRILRESTKRHPNPEWLCWLSALISHTHSHMRPARSNTNAYQHNTHMRIVSERLARNCELRIDNACMAGMLGSRNVPVGTRFSLEHAYPIRSPILCDHDHCLIGPYQLEDHT